MRNQFVCIRCGAEQHGEVGIKLITLDCGHKICPDCYEAEESYELQHVCE